MTEKSIKHDEKKIKGQGRPKSIEKRNLILSCASELFLEKGYTQSSMDEVAKASSVSKQTVYSHFKNKQSLYTAVIAAKCAEYQIEDFKECVNNVSLEQVLSKVALSFLKLLTDPSVIDMYTVVIGEAKQNTEVAELFYQAGPVVSVQLLAKLLVAHPQSKLSPKSAEQAAHDFFNLLKGDFHMLSMLQLDYDKEHVLSSEHINSVVKKALALITLYP